ncbi:MAG: hypothetical protein ACLUI3_03835 [Christensenellales bacterium]
MLDADGPIACEVTRVYQMGKEEMAYLRMGECDFRAYIDSRKGWGDQVHLALKSAAYSSLTVKRERIR